MNRCCSYLLEKTGDIEGAFKMSLNVSLNDTYCSLSLMKSY